MRVRDVMTTNVVAARPGDTLKAAARKMIEAGVSGLPVVDDDGKVIGIITEADFVAREAEKSRGRYRRLLEALFGEREALVEANRVEDAMTRFPVVIHPEARIVEAARMMAERKVKRLPVVDDEGRLVGIISRADIVGAFVRPDEEIERQIRDDVIRRILMIDDRDLQVNVNDGVVTLQGTVPTRSDAQLLVELAGRLEGVVRVESDLRWKIDDTVDTESPRPVL